LDLIVDDIEILDDRFRENFQALLNELMMIELEFVIG
jgi:hypothetical protein